MKTDQITYYERGPWLAKEFPLFHGISPKKRVFIRDRTAVWRVKWEKAKRACFTAEDTQELVNRMTM